MTKTTKREVVLALYPNAIGFGYALLESPREPWDCGVVRIRNVNNQACMKRIQHFVEYYKPVLVVVRKGDARVMFKGTRIEKLIQSIVEFSKSKGIPVKQYSRDDIRMAFEDFGLYNKHEIAQKIAEFLPQFKDKLPAKRLSYQAEHFQMGLFDVLALGLTYFYLTD